MINCCSKKENQKIFPKLKKFDEDNDTLTDDEQLDLEIKRGNECLTQFLEKVKEKKDYIKTNISRKILIKNNPSGINKKKVEDGGGSKVQEKA